MLRTVAVAGAAAVAAGQSLTPTCYLDVPSQGVTYDLSSMIGQNFNVQDNRNDTDVVSFDTWFGVCSNVVPRADFLPTCQSTQGDDGTTNTGPASVFQVDSRNGICHRLGGDARAAQMGVAMNNTQGLADRVWAHGVYLQYTGGEKCTDWTTGNEFPRQTTIFYECYDNPVVPVQTMVLEETMCQYVILIKSRHGCPAQCREGSANGRVCSGHGVCGYDATNQKAKCYCNSGWEGDAACATFIGVDPVRPAVSYGGNIAGGFFGGILGGVICVVGFLGFKAWRAGGTWRDALDFAALFSGGAGGGSGGSGIGSAYTYAKAPEAPAFAGAASTDYAPPAVDSAASAYAPPAGDNGPMLA